jgi:hypothetical protein
LRFVNNREQFGADAIDTMRSESSSSAWRGRINHLAFDSVTHSLYVAALDNKSAEVLDVDASSHLKSLEHAGPRSSTCLGGTGRSCRSQLDEDVRHVGVT